MSSLGLKPPPRHAPRRLRNTEDLRTLQRLMTHALVRPLTGEDGLQDIWVDGRPMKKVAAEFIKPNGRLTAFDRLELYNRMYWFRLIDCVHDDCPGLRALLGEAKFSALVRAFLARYPSRSFSLRDLCARLDRFIGEEPQWTSPQTALAIEVARFEWAQTVAFDGEERCVLTADEIAATPPSRFRLGLQPYVSLLSSDHAVDDFLVAVKKNHSFRGTVSNSSDVGGAKLRRVRKLAAPRRERVWVAVHRVENRIYSKRLERPAFQILAALRDGRTLTQAIAAGGAGVRAEDIRDWFRTWMQLGWLCPR